jgi:hypothetical protein
VDGGRSFGRRGGFWIFGENEKADCSKFERRFVGKDMGDAPIFAISLLGFHDSRELKIQIEASRSHSASERSVARARHTSYARDHWISFHSRIIISYKRLILVLLFALLRSIDLFGTLSVFATRLERTRELGMPRTRPLSNPCFIYLFIYSPSHPFAY